MSSALSNIVGDIPYRMAFAGGWIDQPFVSQLNPAPPGSMVVVGLQPVVRFMERSGMATGTRKVAMQLWNNQLPSGDCMGLVKDLYRAENQDLPEPSGSQDMIGLIYPGINRLDFDHQHEGGFFPVHIESNRDPAVAAWLDKVVHMIPVAPRPDGYNPLQEKHLDSEWVRRLGQSGKDCFGAIIDQNEVALGASMNESMVCWEALLPNTVEHHTLTVDLKALLAHYQDKYCGAMYSGCGGGYLYVISQESVPGSFSVQVRI